MKKEYFVIGDPVEHSVSPQIHNTIFEYYGKKDKYEKIRIKKDQIEKLVEDFRNGGKGFNITVPHKSNIIPFLDGISEEVRRVNAVNTVINKGGIVLGYNTDIRGFAMQVEREGYTFENARVKIIGAGGAARGIAYSALIHGARVITVYNRTVANGENIVAMLNSAAKDLGRECQVKALPLDQFDPGFCDLLINATSVGLGKGHEEEMPVENLDGILPHTAVFDIIYDPARTRFMREAQKHGNKAYNGLDMLIYQGVIANDIWCGLGATDNKELIDEIRNRLTRKE